MKTAFLVVSLVCGMLPAASGQDAFVAALREHVATLPILESSSQLGSPNFAVLRLNAAPVLVGGERYGAIRVLCPPDQPRSLAWLFADTTNIEEYGLLSSDGIRLESQFTRFIQPATADADPEQERPGRPASTLPRPWDIFQLHVLAVPAAALKPGAECLVWFRFSDQRPTDLLLAATFLDPAAKREAADLPAIFALPALGAP